MTVSLGKSTHRKKRGIFSKSVFLTGLLLSVTLLPVHAQNTPLPRVKPAPPAPVYLAQSDYDKLRSIFKALDNRQFSRALTLRQSLNDSMAQSLADWAYFRKNKNADLSKIDTFITSHANWPSIETIQKNAEKGISPDATPSDVLSFFDQREPITGTGKLRLAQAFLKTGNQDSAQDFFKKAWIDHNWNSTQEREIIRQYGHLLSQEDHYAKADRQLFEVKATNTRRLIPYLKGEKRRMINARIALLRRDKGAPYLLSQLSDAERLDSGVLHAATRYYRRGGDELKAISYAVQAPRSEVEVRDPNRWWTERKLLSRWALKNGHFNHAYELAAYSGLIDGANFAQAEFEAGWIALRFLNQPDKAKAHFAYLNSGVSAPISVARAQYWLGRSYEASDDGERANLHYKVAAQFPLTYYGQLAFEKVKSETSPALFPEITSASSEDKALFDSRPMVHAMQILAELKRDREFIFFARQLDDQLQTPGEYAAYEKLMFEEGKPFLSVRAGKVAVKRNASAPSVSYPFVFIPDEATEYVEKALILGLSRQESEFNARALSSAKARGMMQLLPSTAKLTARKEGIPYRRNSLLDDPSYNIIIGAAHLSHLIERYEGSYIMTLAAYNAGPHRVTKWIETYGDPRHPDVDPVDWVELIPFSETRNYVQRVLENTQIYRARINKDAIPGNLSLDLIRGGGTTTAIGINPPSPVLSAAHQSANSSQVASYNSAPDAIMKLASFSESQLLAPGKSSGQIVKPVFVSSPTTSTTIAVPVMEEKISNTLSTDSSPEESIAVTFEAIGPIDDKTDCQPYGASLAGSAEDLNSKQLQNAEECGTNP